MQNIFHRYIFDNHSFQLPTSEFVKLLGRNKSSLSPKEKEHARTRIQQYIETTPKRRCNDKLNESLKKINLNVKHLSKERKYIKEVKIESNEFFSQSPSLINSTRSISSRKPGHIRQESAPLKKFNIEISYKELFEKKQKSAKRLHTENLKNDFHSTDTSVLRTIMSPRVASIEDINRSITTSFKEIYPNADELLKVRKNFFRLYNSKNNN